MKPKRNEKEKKKSAKTIDVNLQQCNEEKEPWKDEISKAISVLLCVGVCVCVCVVCSCVSVC